MKKLFAKLSKIQHMGFALLVAGAMVSCQKEDIPTVEPEFTPEEQAEMAAADKFAAANSVYRALALINELPDDWENVTYTPAEGVPVDEANTDIRNVVSTGAEYAKQYFLSIVPDLGLNGDTWSHEGVGTLTYRTVDENNCYAVIDVDLVQMPGLKQLRFVPEAVVGENKWQGTPYYAVGDVIKDKKTGVYWICVRPSGGPLAKDYAYFVSFDKRLIKTKEQKQDIYEVTGTGEKTKIGKTKIVAKSGTWVYAKNLVEERIAYAAAHVLAYFADASLFMEGGYPGARGFHDKAQLDGFFDVGHLTMHRYDEQKVFYLAYGSYQSAGSKKCSQSKYIQPVFAFSLEPDMDLMTLQNVKKAWPAADKLGKASKHLMSLTAGHDPLTYAYLGEEPEGYDKPFSILDYTFDFTPKKEPPFSFLEGPHMLFMPTEQEERLPLVMTQMSLEDHGKAVAGYTTVLKDIVGAEAEVPDYWLTIENCNRVVFESGKEFDLVAVPE